MSVVIKALQQAARSGTGTQDFAPSGFSAAEPIKLGLFWLAPSTAAGTALDHGRFCIGFTDGTTHRAVSIRSQDVNVLGGNSNCDGRGLTTCLMVYSPTNNTIVGQMDFSSFGTAGEKFVGNWATAASSQWLVNSLLIGGSSTQVKVGEIANSATQDAELTETLGFPWDLVFFITKNSAFSNANNAGVMISIGVATYEAGVIKQGVLSFFDKDAVNPSVCWSDIEDDRAIRVITATPAEGTSVEITGRTATELKYTTRDGTTAIPFAYAALKFDGISGVSLKVRDTRTATGTDDFDTPAHTAQAVISIASQLDTMNAGSGMGTFGFGVFTETAEMSSAFMSANAVTTVDAKSITDSVGLNVPTPTGAAGTKANLTSFDDLGANFNYTSVLGTARKQLLITIGRPYVFLTPVSVSEGQANLTLSRDQLLTPQALGEGQAAIALTRGRVLALTTQSASMGQLTLSRDRLLNLRTQGGVLDFLPLTITNDGGASNPVQLLCVAQGEVLTQLSLLRDRWASPAALGEGFAGLRLGVAWGLSPRVQGAGDVRVALSTDRLLTARAEGQAATQLGLLRDRYLTALTQAQADPQLMLVRARCLSSVLASAADARLALGVAWGLSPRTIGQTLNRLQLAVDRFLQARTQGEAGGKLLLVEFADPLAQSVELIHVRSFAELVHILSAYDVSHLKQSVEVTHVPKEVV